MVRTIKGACVVLFFLVLVPSSLAYLTDSANYLPPTSGPYPFYPTSGNWGPGQAGFLQVGDSYVDPVFGETITRVGDHYPDYGPSYLYAKNGFWNADSTLFVSDWGTNGVTAIVDVSTGQVASSYSPSGMYFSFSPVDPDILYDRSGSNLREINVVTGQSTTIKTFSGTLGNSGGSVDWISADGRYFMLDIGGSVRIWDKQTDTLYSGSISAGGGGGWDGISPDGNFVVTDGRRSYAINHQTQTLSASSNTFWTQCGDHADILSASDGNTYAVVVDCNMRDGVWAVDVSRPESSAFQLFSANAFDLDYHFSGVSRGVLQDWMFVDTENLNGDKFNTQPTQSNWYPYGQEIIMANVLTGEVRRLAHHRSRSVTGPDYTLQPHVSVSWDGSKVMYASNYGSSAGTGYSDIYMMDLSYMVGSVVCGDGTCNGAETCSTCSADCGVCPTCGDGTCNGAETCSSCSSDCGVCPTCGDGTCNGAETCSTCSGDCGVCPTDYSIEQATITVDGNLNDWSSIQSVTFGGTGRGAQDNSVIVKAAWDTNNLYLAYDVSDTELIALETANDGNGWQDDAIEMHIDTLNNGGSQMQTDDYQIFININNAVGDTRGTGSGKDGTWDWTGLQSAVSLQGTLNNGASDTGYIVEVALPWSSVGVTPSVGQQIGLDFEFDEADSDGQFAYSWSGLVSFANPDGWNLVGLIGGSGPVCGDGNIDTGETCDDGVSNGVCPAACSSSCTINVCPVCGDGNIDAGETCDDGASNGVCPAACSATCTTNSCGTPLQLLVWDTDETQGVFTGDTADFYASYEESGSPVVGATCTIDIQGIVTGQPMTYDSQLGIHFYQRIFSSTGTLTYDVTCSGGACAGGSCAQLMDNGSILIQQGCVDIDGDTYFVFDAATCPAGNDCNDIVASINPGASEICGDSIDNNCNSQTDEGCSSNAAPVLSPIGNQIVSVGQTLSFTITGSDDVCTA